jgi:hypothetical protein
MKLEGCSSGLLYAFRKVVEGFDESFYSHTGVERVQKPGRWEESGAPNNILNRSFDPGK